MRKAKEVTAVIAILFLASGGVWLAGLMAIDEPDCFKADVRTDEELAEIYYCKDCEEWIPIRTTNHIFNKMLHIKHEHFVGGIEIISEPDEPLSNFTCVCGQHIDIAGHISNPTIINCAGCGEDWELTSNSLKLVEPNEPSSPSPRYPEDDFSIEINGDDLNLSFEDGIVTSDRNINDTVRLMYSGLLLVSKYDIPDKLEFRFAEPNYAELYFDKRGFSHTVKIDWGDTLHLRTGGKWWGFGNIEYSEDGEHNWEYWTESPFIKSNNDNNFEFTSCCVDNELPGATPGYYRLRMEYLWEGRCDYLFHKTTSIAELSIREQEILAEIAVLKELLIEGKQE